MSARTERELVVVAPEMRELFSQREFDPFTDETGTLWSVAQIEHLSDVVRDLAKMTLRISLPAPEVRPETETAVRSAIGRYCKHKIEAARLQMVAWRRGAWISVFWSALFFALSLTATWLVQRAEFLAEPVRELAAETIIIAGWVIMWNPMDTLIEGWIPIRNQDRVYRAIDAMPVVVEGRDV